MLKQPTIPGLFITGTDTDVGKTLIAGAIADQFARRGLRVAVCKPIASGCERRREGLVSPDAEFLAAAARSRHPLDAICPIRLEEPLAPAIAAERAGVDVDFDLINAAVAELSRDADVMIVEGAGGILVPVRDGVMVIDMIRWLALPTVVVARPRLGTINHTLMTVAVLRAARVDVAGVVINRYPAEFPGAAEESAGSSIERWGDVPVLATVPEVEGIRAHVPSDVAAAIDTMDFSALLRGGRRLGRD
jgi:dethiobiotin synthetase